LTHFISHADPQSFLARRIGARRFSIVSRPSQRSPARCGGEKEGISLWQAGLDLDLRKNWHVFNFRSSNTTTHSSVLDPIRSRKAIGDCTADLPIGPSAMAISRSNKKPSLEIGLRASENSGVSKDRAKQAVSAEHQKQ
jgi:hypothetical protein